MLLLSFISWIKPTDPDLKLVIALQTDVALVSQFESHYKH